MSGRPESNDSPDEFPAPPRLVAALQTLAGSMPAVPKGVDEAILLRAREYLDPKGVGGQRRVPSVRKPAGWASSYLAWGPALAAALFLGLGIAFLVRQRVDRNAVLAREDIDRNGRVDILDALALARRLEATSRLAPETRREPAEFDLNGDGVVDQLDVDRVAAIAVKLTKG